MRRPIIAGNWKMNKTVAEAVSLVTELKGLVSDVADVDVVVCPPFTALYAVGEALRGSGIGLGAQDMHWEPKGAYTGEISAQMLLTTGCQYVILGHSERRAYFGDTNETVCRKVKAAVVAGLTPIVCVGETLQQRQAGTTEAVVKDHVVGALAGISSEDAVKVAIAYEPVWAIGTGLTATPEQAQEVHVFIRNELAHLYDKGLADEVRIQYGGSMKPENSVALLAQPDIDGGLIGGASLDARSFSDIIKSA